MNNNRQTTAKKDKASKLNVTPSTLFRAAGVATMAAGIFFAAIQPIHPADVLSSVTTTAWAIITPLKTLMSFLFLLGITAIYARQVREAGWLGLIGFLLLSAVWALELAFIFAETFIFPPLATAAPTFVEGVLGLFNGHPVDTNLGALPTLWAIVGVLYMLGGLVFGIATFRAGVLPRWAALLLAITSVATPAAALLPHEQQRLIAMPVGFALAWLGYALWSERRSDATASVASVRGSSLQQVATE